MTPLELGWGWACGQGRGWLQPRRACSMRFPSKHLWAHRPALLSSLTFTERLLCARFSMPHGCLCVKLWHQARAVYVILGPQIASNKACCLVPLSVPLLTPKSLETTRFRKPRFKMAQLPSDFKKLRSREQFRAFWHSPPRLLQSSHLVQIKFCTSFIEKRGRKKETFIALSHWGLRISLLLQLCLTNTLVMTS